MDNGHSLEDLQTMFETNPQMFNIVEEPIDIDLQLGYFKRARKLKKQARKLEDVLAMVPQLYDEHLRVEEKRDILILLASFESVEAFRALEAYWKTAQGDVRPWVAMAYQESKMSLESSLLDEKQVLISTGLGGKGYKLRYFICFLHNEDIPYTNTQQKIIQNELSYIFKDYQAECETVEFSGSYAKILALMPLAADVREILIKVAEECNQYGNFISHNFMVTNVKALDDEEITELVQTRELEAELAEQLSSMGFGFDYDDDDDDDD
ncbi:MAG: hypothetical protein FWC39_12430 [Bacteroidetes bacterium]|nr:hypothetical protein [Bacteroidota bacterium]